MGPNGLSGLNLWGHRRFRFGLSSGRLSGFRFRLGSGRLSRFRFGLGSSRLSGFRFGLSGGRLKWRRALLDAFAMPFQERARLDGQVIVENIADHMRRARKFYRTRFDLAVDRTVNDDGICCNLAFYMSRFTDQQYSAPNIALDRAIYLDFTVTTQIADDPKVFAN